MKTEAQKRARLVERGVVLAISSLKSHLPHTHGETHESQGDNEFHKKCIQEYAELIKILSELY